MALERGLSLARAREGEGGVRLDGAGDGARRACDVRYPGELRGRVGVEEALLCSSLFLPSCEAAGGAQV